MANRFQVTGVNDRASHCECCGRNGLKVVVWIVDTETGEEKHFGTSCATAPAKGFDCVPEIKAAVRTAQQRIKASWSVAARRYREAGGTYINGRDNDGAPIRTVADNALWEKFRAEEESRALARG